MPTIVVHHLERSRSHRILWLLEELGLEYSIETYQRDPETMRAPATLRAVHPLGKSPVVVVDGVVLAESGAIVEHLVEVSGTLAPPAGTEAHRRYRYFLHYAEGSLMPPLLVRLIFDQLEGPKVPFLIRPIAKAIAKQTDAAFTGPEIDNHLAFLESELADRTYLAGDDFTGADIQMSYPLEAASSRGGLGEGHPGIMAYLGRLRSRPAYQRAVERGGPIMIGG